MERKPDLSIQDEFGKTVLHYLLERKESSRASQKIVEAGAPTNQGDVNLNNPIHLAASKDGVEV